MPKKQDNNNNKKRKPVPSSKSPKKSSKKKARRDDRVTREANMAAAAEQHQQDEESSQDSQVEEFATDDDNTVNVGFNEDDNHVVIQVTRSQHSEFMEEGENLSDGEDEETTAGNSYDESVTINNNASVEPETIETIAEVPEKYRNPESNVGNTSTEIQEIREQLSRFEALLTNNVLIRNPEYGLQNTDQNKGKKKDKSDKRGRDRPPVGKDDSASLISNTTIYKPVLKLSTNDKEVVVQDKQDEHDDEIQFNFRNNHSSSDENELIVSSDEFTEVPPVVNVNLVPNQQSVVIPDRFYDDQPRPGTSRQHQQQPHQQNQVAVSKTNRRFEDGSDRAEQLIREAEASKARMYEVPGNEILSNEASVPLEGNNFNRNNVFNHIDDDYLLVASHVDLNMQHRIANGEYVDFAKLLIRDRVQYENDNRMDIVCRSGQTYLVPAADRDALQVTSFSRWEQAFRVFSNVYTRYHPERAAELIEYNFLIHSASLSFQWENVYAYDRDFRLHLARHPERPWSLILQQAWSFRLKDRVQFQGGSSNSMQQGKNRSGREKDTCWRFNKGRCTYGSSCKFDHRCNNCNKFGHGAIYCRKGTGGGYRGGDRNDRGNDRDRYDRSDRNDRNDRDRRPPATTSTSVGSNSPQVPQGNKKT